MAIAIREPGPDELEQVVSLWQAAASSDGTDSSADDLGTRLRRHREMSLVAVDGSQVVGAICFGRCQEGKAVYEVVVDQAREEGDLARRLVDKALRKLGSVGVHGCRISLRHGDHEQAFWESIRWATPGDADSAAPQSEPHATEREQQAA